MSDLIDRQAAIDALSIGKEILSRVLDEIDVVGTDREKYSWGLGLIESNIKDIEELPSAQTDPKKGKWIPVTERLPEEQGSYLVTYYFKGRWVVGIDYFRPKKDDWKQRNYITAWMPLPEPYNRADMRGEEDEQTAKEKTT